MIKSCDYTASLLFCGICWTPTKLKVNTSKSTSKVPQTKVQEYFKIKHLIKVKIFIVQQSCV